MISLRSHFAPLAKLADSSFPLLGASSASDLLPSATVTNVVTVPGPVNHPTNLAMLDVSMVNLRFLSSAILSSGLSKFLVALPTVSLDLNYLMLMMIEQVLTRALIIAPMSTLLLCMLELMM